MPSVFEPCKIAGLELRNRFVRSATWDATADEFGKVTKHSLALYRKLGEGGVGLIVSGYAYVSAIGQAAPGQYGAHGDEMITSLRRLAQAAHQGGARIALQIVHSGVNSPYLTQQCRPVLSVSRMEDSDRLHREMTDADFLAIIAAFASAAVRARQAGFDAVQLHGAHGYLMSQVISPLFNHRKDRWGGSLENRSRFHVEIVKAVRKAAGPDFPLLIKFGVQDDREGGLTLAEGIETARQMQEAGLDAIEVSAGVGQPAGAMKEGEPERPIFRDRAAALKKAVRVPVILVGGIRSPQTAQSIVDSGDADLISMSRPFIREPGLISRWQKGDRRPATCISCARCMGIARRGESLECGQERLLREKATAGA